MRQIILICWLILSSFALLAQYQISGFVVDQNEDPLIGASIYSTGDDNSDIKGTISDIDGSFLLETPHDSFTISYVGFATATFPSVNVKDIKIVMNSIEDLTICYFYSPLLATEASNLTRLYSLFKNASNPTRIREAINQVPAVHMATGGYNTNKLSIRGVGSRSRFATSGVKTFYNNIPLHNSVGESGIEDLGIGSAENIEIIKGHTGSSFESGYAGAILIQNKEAFLSDESNLSSEHTLGPWGMYMMKNKVAIKKWNNVTYHGLTLYQSQLNSDGYRDNNAVNRQNYTLNYRYRKGKVDMTVLANHIRLKAFIPSALNISDFTNEPTKAATAWEASKGNEDYQKSLLGLNLVYQKNKHLAIENTIYFQNFDSEELRPFNTIDEQNNTIGVKGNVRYTLVDEGDLTEILEIGYRVQNENYDYQLFETNNTTKGNPIGSNSENRNIYELYAKSNTTIKHDLNIEAGTNVQYVHLVADDTKVLGKVFISPEITISRKYEHQQKAYLRAGKGYNFYSPQEAVLPNGSYTTNLRPSSAWNLSLGAKGVWRKLDYRAEVYHMWADNILVFLRDQANQPIYSNAGKANYLGFEGDLKYRILGQRFREYRWIDIGGSLFISKNTYTSFASDNDDYSKNRIPGAPQTVANLYVETWVHGIFGSLRSQFVGSYFLNDQNVDQTDSYHLLNATVGYKHTFINNWKLQFKLDAQNILDEKYAAMGLINAQSPDGSSPRFYYPGLPFHLMGSIKLEFVF